MPDALPATQPTVSKHFNAKQPRGKNVTTVVKDSFDVESVRGARLEVRAALELGGEETGSGVGDEARLHLADHVLSADEYQRTVAYRRRPAPALRHLRVVRVDCVEAHLALQAERQDDRVHPPRKLQTHDYRQLTGYKTICLPCSDAVGWPAGSTSSL